MDSKLVTDPRIDPRLKALFGSMEMATAGDVASRDGVGAVAEEERVVGLVQLAE